MLFIALDDELLVFERKAGAWHVDSKLIGSEPQSVTRDPLNPERVYCGTFSDGLWASDDSGETWKRLGKQSIASNITALAVSSIEETNGHGVLYVGTEPSELYRSNDAGKSFDNLSKQMLKLPSSKSWSFPPKPYTHHVRTILLDPVRAGLIYLAIEAGALIRSFDGGKTWRDRVSGGPYDTHNLVSDSRGRLYSAAGDGYYESSDYGSTWKKPDKGLEQTYLYSVAVSPDAILASASPGPWSAYNSQGAESHVYRRRADEGWREVREGLPEPEGTTASFLVPNGYEGFFAANNEGIYETSDEGILWRKVEVPWRDSFRTQHVHCVAIA